VFVQAKRHEREEARRLRAAGVGVRAIAATLGVSLASASTWTRDVAPPAGEQPQDTAKPPAETESETRRCGRCRETLPVSAFNRAGVGRQHWCRACFRDYFAARGDRHRNAVKAGRARRRDAARRHLRAFLEANSCADCGEDELLVLELDHHPGAKRASISVLVNDGPSIAKLEKELERCDVVCVNCHRRRTARRGGWYRVTRSPRSYWTPAQRRNRERILEILSAAGCVDCGERDVLVLDFDHRGDKRDCVTRLANSCSEASLEAEVAKCDVRCANCHTLRTKGSRTWRGSAF